MAEATTNPERTPRLAHDDIVSILGPMTDARLEAIAATGATIEEIEEAAAWAAGESDVMGEARRPVAGPVAAVYEILIADEYLDDRD